MLNTKTMHAGCLYSFEGQASASSCFTQTEEDIQSFMRLSHRILRDFLTIHEYNITKDSWIMIVSLRSREKILKSYKKIREKSKTCDRKNDLKDIWKIISDRMKEFLKQYVQAANRRSGRQGSLVKEPYKRSYFASLEEAQSHVEAIRKQLLKREQALKKYRGRKKFYKIAKKKVKGHILLCSKWKDSQAGVEKFFRKLGNELKAIIEYESLMTSKIIERTLKAHI